MSLESKVLSGAKWSALGMWGRRLIGFFVFAIITRHVSPESLGLVSLAYVYIGFAELFSKQGLGMALVQSKELPQSKINTAFYINMGAALVMALLSIAFADNIARYLGDERLANVIRILAVVFPINASNVAPIALQSRAFDFKSIAFQSFLGTALSGLVAIPMAILGYEVWALVTQFIVFSVVCCSVVWLRTTWRPTLEFSKPEAKELTSFSLKILLSNLVTFARQRSDQIFIGITVGPVGLGLYALGVRLCDTIDSFVKGPLDKVAVSAFSRIQDDKPRLQKALCRSLAINAFANCPIFAGLALLAPEAVKIAFGEQWATAGAICAIIAVRRLFNSLFFFNYHIFISQGFPGTQTTLQALQAIGVIAGAFLGQPWGLTGVAISITISGFFLNILSTYVMCRKVGLPLLPLLRSIAAPVYAALGMAAIVLAARLYLLPSERSDWLTCLTLAPLGILAYAGLIRVFSKSLTFEAVELIKKTLKRKAPRGAASAA